MPKSNPTVSIKVEPVAELKKLCTKVVLCSGSITVTEKNSTAPTPSTKLLKFFKDRGYKFACATRHVEYENYDFEFVPELYGIIMKAVKEIKL